MLKLRGDITKLRANKYFGVGPDYKSYDGKSCKNCKNFVKI